MWSCGKAQKVAVQANLTGVNLPIHRDSAPLPPGFIGTVCDNTGMSKPRIRSTTILTVRIGDTVAMGGDGQVSLGDTVMKADAKKVRPLSEGKVLTGFAGSAADAFALLERFESKLKDHPKNMPRAATELAKDWRTDRALRRLEALIAVADAGDTLLVSGTGDVIQPSDGILGIGSGGNYATAAARALVQNTDLSAEEVVRKALQIAADICVYSNHNVVVETITQS